MYMRRLLFERGSGSDRELCLRFPPQMPEVARSEPAPKPELGKQSSCARGRLEPGYSGTTAVSPAGSWGHRARSCIHYSGVGHRHLSSQANHPLSLFWILFYLSYRSILLLKTVILWEYITGDTKNTGAETSSALKDWAKEIRLFWQYLSW